MILRGDQLALSPSVPIAASPSLPLMPATLELTSRRLGRLIAGGAGLLVLGLAVWVAIVESVPEIGIVDGYWMLAGAVTTFLLVAPFARRWKRDRALAAIAAATLIGAWVPLVALALRAGMPVSTRLRGAIFFSSADIIGLALPVAAALLWLATQEYRGVDRPPTGAGEAS